MKTTVFNCDRCGQPFDADQNDSPKPFISDGKTNILIEVALTIGTHIKSSYSQSKSSLSKQICRNCLENLGLDFGWTEKRKEEYPIYKSLEEKFTDILSELGVKFDI